MKKPRLALEPLEAREVPATLAFQLSDGAFGAGHFSDPAGLDAAQASQRLALSDLTVTVHGTTLTAADLLPDGGYDEDGVATADYAYGVLVGVRAEVRVPGTSDDNFTLSSGVAFWYPYPYPTNAATGAVVFNPPEVTVEKIADAAEGGSGGTFRLTRTGDTTNALTVSYTVGGTATSGTDYTALSGTATFLAGSSTVDVTVAPIDDVEYDPAETVVLAVLAGADYVAGTASEATVTIADDEAAPVYWVGGSGASWSTAANWSNNAVPTSTTAVYFDASYSNYGVTAPGSSGDLQLAELHFVNGYSGTVRLESDLTVGKFEMASANAVLDQPSTTYGSDLTVTAAMLWTNGTINSTAHLANLTITGTGTWATIAPASAGTVWLGSNLSFESNATAKLKDGTVDLVNDDVEISTNTGAELEFAPDTGPIFWGVTRAPNGFIGAGTIWTVRTGASVTFGGKLTNNGGTLTLLSGATVEIAGKDGDAVAYVQGSGATDLYGGSTLATGEDKFVVIAQGRFATIYVSGVGADATIRTDNFKVQGGDIYIAYQGANNQFGQLLIDGNILWTGGTFHTKVFTNGTLCDVWRASNANLNGGQFDIDDGTVAPIYIDSDYSTASLPGTGGAWRVLQAGGGFVDNTAPSVSDDMVWKVTIDATAPPIYWELSAK